LNVSGYNEWFMGHPLYSDRYSVLPINLTTVLYSSVTTLVCNTQYRSWH